MDLRQFLKTATQITAALSRLHRQNIIHQNIRPRNIRTDSETGGVELVGAGEAARGSGGGGAAPEQALSLESLQYASPEQTGRANRPIDQRSDLYSLGILFYEMLTGALPFHAEDAVGWVHCHIAMSPRPLSDVAPSTPKIVSDIVMKLLAKAPEERYQSARGLEQDLARCLSELDAHGRIEPFPIAANDISDKLRLPTKLYGRSREVAALFAAFEQVIATGAAGLALVSGYSGIGKSSLVQELHKPIVRERGFFIGGKFDQYKRDIPYLTIGQAFRELIRQILGESEERLDAWRRDLSEAVGTNGRLIAEVIPQIELILGEQPPVPPLPTAEAQHRFNTVFGNFINVFAKREHPLVLFLDDLQWLDFGSLNLLQHLLTHPETRYLFVLGAYRDNEVNVSHPLVSAIAELRKAGLRVVELTLGPLTREHLSEFASDALHCSRDKVEPLSELLFMKTAGNPFFLTQFLSELCQERLVWFSPEASAWTWDLDAIEAKAYTDNIIDLIVGKLRRLPDGAQEALKLAACIGNEFELGALGAILNTTPEKVTADLMPAFSEGVVLRRTGFCKFLHDRVQQAAYMLIPEELRGELHLRVARLLWAHATKERLEDNLFDIVNQFNLGAALISDAEERRQVAELNLRAGRKAQASVAHKSAAIYLSAGLAVLGESAWGSDHALMFSLHRELAECHIQLGELAESERLAVVLRAHADSRLETAAVYRLQMQLHTTKGESEAGIRLGIECLKLFGIELLLHPGKAAVQAALVGIEEAMGDRQVEDLLDVPLVDDAEVVAIVDTLADLYLASVFWTDTELVELVVCNMVRVSVDRGNTRASTIGYALFGAYLKVPRGEYRDAYRFGKLAFDLVDKHNLIAYKAQVCNVLDALILHWSRPLREVVHYARLGIQAGIETGNVAYTCFNSAQCMLGVLFSGASLDDVYAESVRSVDILTRGKLAFAIGIPLGVQRFARNMQGLTDDFSTFVGGDFDQRAFEEQLLQARVPITCFYYFTMKLAARFISGNYAEALAAAATAAEFEPHCSQHMIVPECTFFSGLAAAASCVEATPEEKAEISAVLRARAEKLRVWAASCPENYHGKHQLLSAEIARIAGRDQEAARLYDDSIRSFRASGFIQQEAIANELAARFYMDRSFLTIPEAYLRAASACFARWGAHGKVRQLHWQYPDVLGQEPVSPSPHEIGTPAEQFDTVTAFKASRALSHETVPEKLLASLLRIVIEHAGAQRCCLLLPSGGRMEIVAEATVEPQGIDVRLAALGHMISSDTVPASIINYVKRTREKALFDDASTQSTLLADAYIVRERPKSLLCLPLLRHASIEGLLYLENKLVAGAFTPRRLALLEFLGAISLENATLYIELARENEGRRLAEKTLLESEERLRRLIETANVIPWELDAGTGHFTYMGPQITKVIGYPQEAWTERAGLDLLSTCIHPEDRDEGFQGFLDAKSGEKQFDFRVVSTSGRTTWLHNVVSAPRRHEGRTVLSGFMVDISDRKEIESKLREQLETIQRQQDAIRKLSTPIIEVWEGVLTMPVLGAIDSQRAEQMMEVILSAVTRTGCRFTIIDVTAVETVDASTADHILRITRALKLLGSRGIVVGIRPEVAQTMVSLGVDLSTITTLANLREALLLCMRSMRTRQR